MIKRQRKPLFDNSISSLIFLLSYLIIPVYCGIKFYPPFLLKYIFLIYFFTASIAYALWRRSESRKVAFSIRREERLESINLLNEEVKTDSKIIFTLKNKIQRYTILKSLTDKLVQSLSLENTVKILLDKVYSLLADSKGVIILYLLDTEKQRLNLFASLRGKESVPKEKNGDIFDLWVFRHQAPLIVEDTKKDFRFDVRGRLESERPVGSLISAPLIVGKRIIGVLRLDNEEAGSFSSDDLRYLSVISDLAALSIDNSRLYQHTQQLAITDGLTGFYLRQYFMLRLNEEIKQAKANNRQFSLLMIDIDHFKNYNDTFGHISGDIVLTRIAKSLKESCPEKSILSRYGGEEFVVLLIDTDKTQAVQIAGNLRKEIETKKIILRRVESSVTVSIGISTCPQDGVLGDKLIQKADLYLYKAKESGRNRVCFC